MQTLYKENKKTSDGKREGFTNGPKRQEMLIVILRKNWSTTVGDSGRMAVAAGKR
jgi:hypothetical protein